MTSGSQSLPLQEEATPRAFEPLATLIDRTTFGYREPDLAIAKQLGFDGWVDWQLDYIQIDDSAVEDALEAYPTLKLTARQMTTTYTIAQGNQDVPKTELRAARLLRAVASRRQLFERMVEFWTDHFNIKILLRDNFLKHIDDRLVIRRHALGNFGQLLNASARSAAMLVYLDNFLNVAGAPNENYAREVMELHTLGVEGPYTEDDVRELARCFTGWTFAPSIQPDYGKFVFDPSTHDTGPKTVLGLQIPAGGGEEDAQMVLDYLAMHPVTAQFLASKLARFLLGYEPAMSAIDAAAQAFLSTGGDIKAMLKALLTREHLELAKAAERSKLKRPLHLLASFLRAIDAPLADPAGGIDLLTAQGHLPYDWPAPNGYPDALGAWGSTLLPRWSGVHDIAMGQEAWTGVDPAGLLASLQGQSIKRWAGIIVRRLSGGNFRPVDQQRLQAFVLSQAGQLPLETLAAEAFGLAALSPSFQRY